MTVNELYTISERIDQLASDAYGFNWSPLQIIEEIRQLADFIRDDADTLAEQIASSISETDMWYDTSKELA
jgi:uncharacterized coiled-coil DUF342 family protein